MDFKTFLSLPHVFANVNEKRKILAFTGRDYVPLFFNELLKKISSEQYQLVRVDLQQINFEQLKLSLEMPSLVSRYCYWLGSVESWPANERKKLAAYLISYQGSHAVCYFIKQEKSNSTKVADAIVLPHQCSQSLAQNLSFWRRAGSLTKLFTQRLFSKQKHYSLDQLCLLLNYAEVVSFSMYKEFFDCWLDQIIFFEHSLFELSTHFFSGNAIQFFSLWHRLSCLYPVQFWISFWSEQLTRASCFRFYAQKNDFTNSRQCMFRLPFSFINNDWKKHTVEGLRKLHDQLYCFDFHLKNGGQQHGIDIFFVRYFTYH